MRILLVHNVSRGTDITGIGESVAQLAVALETLGHAVSVLGRGEGGVPGPKLLFPLLAVPWAWRRLVTFRPDVVQVHESDGALVALLVRIHRALSKRSPRLLAHLAVSYCTEAGVIRPIRRGDRLIARPSVADYRFRYLKAPLQVLLGRLTARCCDAVFAVSRANAGELEADYGAREVSVMPSVGRWPLFEGGLAEETPSRYILYAGRLSYRKGVDVLIAAMAEIGRRHPELQLLIAGDGERRQRLARSAASMGLGERVRFLGRCRPERMSRLYAGAQCLVLPSLYEGMPLVVLEAMAQKTPVVATAVGGTPELVEHEATGLLIEPGSPRAVAEAVCDVLEHPDRARRRAQRALARLDADFDPLDAARHWLAVARQSG